MTKRNLFVTVMIALLVISLSACVLVACDPPETKEYTVKFDVGLEGVQAIESIKAKANEEIDLPSAPTVSDQTFLGWFDGETKYAAGAKYKVTKDVTLVGKWTDGEDVDVVEIKFDGGYEGAAKINSIYANVGSTIKLPDAPERNDENFEFEGWHLEDAEFLFDAGADYLVSEAATFVASWMEIGFIDPEYRGDYNAGVDFTGGVLGTVECYHIEANKIYYQGREVTDLERRSEPEGGYRFTAHFYTVFGKADNETISEERFVGDDGVAYEVWDSSFIAELFFEDNMLVMYPHQIGEDADYKMEPDVLSKISGDEYGFNIQFSANTGAEDSRSFKVANAANGYVVGEAPEIDDKAFLGWYTDSSGFAPWLPGMKYDPQAKFYLDTVYVAVYVYNATFVEENGTNTIAIDSDDDGSYFMFNGQQRGYARYVDDDTHKYIYYYDYNWKLIGVYEVNAEDFTYTDVTPEPVDGTVFAGNWYGLFFDGSYYRFDISGGDEIGSNTYQVTSWLPGRKGVKGNTVSYSITAEGEIELRVGGYSAYGIVNDDGTMALTIFNRNQVEATLVKVGTIEGTWSSANMQAKFSKGIATINGKMGTYEAGYNSYTVNDIEGETLTITVSEYGEMVIASNATVSSFTGAFMPGTTPYTRPTPDKDEVEGAFHGEYDEDWVFRYDFDGLGNLTVYSWDINPNRPSKAGSSTYKIERDVITFNIFGTNYEATLTKNNTVMIANIVKSGNVVDTRVLVTEKAILGSYVVNGEGYVFADGKVEKVGGGQSVPYTFNFVPYNGDLKYPTWTATLDGVDYTFYFVYNDAKTDKVELVVKKSTDDVVLPKEDEFVGTWYARDGAEESTLILAADHTGSYELTGTFMEMDDDAFELTWSYIAETGTITITRNDESAYSTEGRLAEGKLVYLGYTHDKQTASESGPQEQETDYQSLIQGAWEYDDSEELTLYTFTFDGNGQVTIAWQETYGDGEEDSTQVAYTVDAQGNVSFDAGGFDGLNAVTGTIGADGKLTLTLWGDEYTLTK